ncbi:hypothetical protein SPONN_1537 [uncultured Candidatus Thioglobus sp.]|nr:hypothetical protein SPONN_1537 [uncultured Candidatus Thioglobus sp.]
MLSTVFGSFISPIVGKVLSLGCDALVDLEVYSTARGKKMIQAVVKESIKKLDNCILVGHSLGSVVCFDIICDLMRQGEFDGKYRNEWPIRGFVSLGSILTTRRYYENRKNLPTHNGKDAFQWLNIYDPQDPFVEPGTFDQEDYYTTDAEEAIDEPNPYAHIPSKAFANTIYTAKQPNQWNVDDKTIKTAENSGLTGFANHTSYWDNKAVADNILKLSV